MVAGSRRVTFQQSLPPPAWTGWDNPFLDGSEVRAEAEQLLQCWREGSSDLYDPRHPRDGNDEVVTQSVLPSREQPLHLSTREQTTKKLFEKFLKWKGKMKLFKNLF